MSTERDTGLQALQQGDPATAMVSLEAACRRDPNDFEAHMFLGAAYGQLARQMDAIHSITRAVQIQPHNAQARYNLAVAMQQGGFLEQAEQALNQALTLQPDYPRATEMLDRLRAGPERSGPAPTAEVPTDLPRSNTNMATSSMQDRVSNPAASPTSSEGATQPFNTQQPAYVPAAPSPQVPASGVGTTPLEFGRSGNVEIPGVAPDQAGIIPPSVPPPMSAPGYAAWPEATSNPSAQAPPATTPYQTTPGPYGQPPAVGAPYQSPAGLHAQPLPAGAQYQPAIGPYGSPPPTPYGEAAAQSGFYSQGGLYGQLAGSMAKSERALNYEDRFDLAEAVRSWGRIIARPASFFREMAGTAGMRAPMALSLLYVLPILVAVAIRLLQHKPAVQGAMDLSPAYNAGMVLGVLLSMPILLCFVMASAWVLHLIGLLFGNRTPYSGSFRALIFSYAPAPMFILVNALFPVGPAPNSINPIAIVLALVGLVWWQILMVAAISSEQEISVGAAFVVVMLAWVALIGVAFVVTIGVFILFAAIGFSAAAAHGMLTLI